MDIWQQEYFHLSQQNVTAEELFPLLLKQANNFGFEYCTYVLYTPIPFGSENFVWISNYPEILRTDYKGQNLFEIDTSFNCALRSFRPVLWSAKTFKKEPRFFEFILSHLHQPSGWTYPFHLPNKVVGMFVLSRQKEPITAEELEKKQQDMAWMAGMANQSMMELLLPRLVPEMDIQFTSRQREVLSWIVEGKTSEEIAEILRISKQTVDFHSGHIMKKLGVENETAAAVRAVILKLL